MRVSQKKEKEMRVKLDKGAFEVVHAHEDDAGYDLRTPYDFTIYDNKVIDTGVHMEIPKGYVGFLKSKSGLNVKHSLTGEGVIDSGYTGSIVVKLYNNSEEPHKFNKGDKIIQIVLLPVYTPDIEYVDELDDTERGNQGFGSSGK